MKNRILSLLTGTAALALAATAASAADLPVRAAPPAPVIAAVPVFTWTGFYVGVNAGYGWNTNNDTPYYDPVFGYLGGSNNDGGFVGGGQIGYNYQIGSFVLGAEADIQWADIGNNNRYLGYYYYGRNNSDWFGTVRARAGVALDRFLIYATGGFAFDDGNGGWTVGGGVEWALPVNWFNASAVTFGVEGLYVNLDRGNDNLYLTNVAYTTNKNTEIGVVRAKLNFKFGTY